MVARIFKPAKSAMSSGQARTKDWVLEFEPAEARVKDPLMGWTGSGDTQAQVRLEFDDLEQARAYAEKHGIPYQVMQPKPRKPNIRPGGYGDNFASGRRVSWTH
ncbi:ETC complex I subunit [Halovulum dunhuangense]|uniref:ETC complex I subunit n=1 Tax=Halovulum dunhuangense TaxID=1505036 RepID=A0A849L3H5_9RHOB|nr:ETC complex I subunit [Halovulum dunhuangense]NNU80906.1 ETC complex I subunit [Halovulum dunhuangense]